MGDECRDEAIAAVANAINPLADVAAPEPLHYRYAGVAVDAATPVIRDHVITECRAAIEVIPNMDGLFDAALDTLDALRVRPFVNPA
jgi:hypothetical protein